MGINEPLLRTVRAAAIFGVAALSIGLASSAAAAQTAPAPILHDTFDDDDGGWNIFGGSGNITITRDAAQVKVGKGALQFDYPVEKGKVGLLVRPIMPGTLAKAKSLRIWARDTKAATLMFVLQEHEGGRYVAFVTVPKDRWQLVELTPSDFALSTDANDPKDPDGKLDLDQVEAVGIGDMGQLLVQSDNVQLVSLFGVQTGPRTLYLDDFTVSDQPEVAAPAAAADGVVVDDFSKPQINWMMVGIGTSTVADGKPMTGRSLQVSYHQAPGKIAGLVRNLAAGRLANSTGLQFDVASAVPMKLVVQVEETDGGKYNTVVTVAGSQVVQKVSVSFVDFNAADDSHDSNGKLDRELINKVVLMDVTGMADMTEADNTLWVGPIRATTGK